MDANNCFPKWYFQMIFPNLTMVNLLLDCGADVNARNESRSTPLHVAATPYNFDAVVSLVLDIPSHLSRNTFSPLIDRAQTAGRRRPPRPAEQERYASHHIHHRQSTELDSTNQLHDAQMSGRHSHCQIQDPIPQPSAQGAGGRHSVASAINYI